MKPSASLVGSGINRTLARKPDTMKKLTPFVLIMFLSSCAMPPSHTQELSGQPCPTNAATTYAQNPVANTLMHVGGNLLATAAANYSQHYGQQLGKLLGNLVSPKKKQQPQEASNDFNQGFPNDQNDGSFESFPQEDGAFDPNLNEPFPGGEGEPFPQDGEFNESFDPNAIPEDQFGGNEEEGSFPTETSQNFPPEEDVGFEEGGAQNLPNEEVDPNFSDEPISRGIPGPYGTAQAQVDPCVPLDGTQPNEPYYTGGPNEGYPSDPNVGSPTPTGSPYENQTEGDYSYNANVNTPPYDENEPRTQAPYPAYSEHGPSQGQPMGIDVVLVRKAIRNGAPIVVPIQDGEILKDGRGNPHAGDKFRIMFRANSNSYVYVIAIDGSGWAQGVFPPPGAPLENPVTKDTPYVLPGGSNWFSLDQIRGVETIFVVVSHTPRRDIEDVLKGITGRERPATATLQQVTKAAIIPHGFGGVRPSQTPFGLNLGSGGEQQVLPTSFFARTAGEDLRVTRWFRHQ